MAVTFDAATGATGAGVDSKTFSHTTASQSNRIILIGISWIDLSTEGLSIDTVTYAGTAATFLAASGISNHSDIWYLYAPATGANNVIITWAGDLGAGGVNVVCGAMTFYGVHQTAGLGTASTATGTSTAPSVSVTGVSTDNFIVDNLSILYGASVTSTTIGAGQTSQWGTSIGANPSIEGGFSSREASAVGAVTMSWTLGVSRAWATGAVEIKAAAAAALAAVIFMNDD